MERQFLILLFLIIPLFLGAQTPDSTTVLQTIDSLLQKARNLCDSGQFDEATTQNDQAAELVTTNFGTTSAHFGKVAFNYGWVLEESGNYPEAETWYLKAKDITVQKLGKESPVYPVNLNSLGVINYYMGKYEKAESYYLEAMTINEKKLGRENPRVIGRRHNLGILYHEMGQYEKAEGIFAENLAIQEKVEGKETRQYASSLNSLAILYDDMGNYEKSEACFIAAADLYRKVVGEDHPAYSYCIENLADLYLKTGKYAKAEAIYAQSLALREKAFGKEHPKYATSLDNLGLLQKQEGHYEAAEKLLLEAQTIREKSLGEAHPEYAGSIVHLAELYTAMGQSDKALSFFIQAQQLQQKALGTDHPDYIATINDLSRLYLTRKQPGAAAPLIIESNTSSVKLVRRASTHLSEQEMQSYLASFQENADRLFAFNQQYPTPAIAAQAFNNILFYKGFLLNNAVQLQKIIGNAPETTQQKYLEWKALQRQLSGEYSLPVSERGNTQALEEQANALEKELAHLLNGFEDLQRDITWQDVQNHLTQDQAVIEFIHYQSPDQGVYYSAFIVKKGLTSPLFVPLFQEKQLGNIQAIRGLYATNKTGTVTPLKMLIWDALAPHLAGIKTLYYAPSGSLHRINIGAIPVSDTETIANRFSLHCIGTSRQLVLPESNQLGYPRNALVLGGIDYGADETETQTDSNTQQSTANALGSAYRSMREHSWPYLPWTKKEAEDIYATLEKSGIQATLLEGREAREENMKKYGAGTTSPAILHLATHGYFFPDADSAATTSFIASKHPLIRSGLILAGANAAWLGTNIPDASEDGILTAHEIAQLDLRNTDLVVLSACDTGLGDLEGNEGVYGLQRAFKLAGARYVIMSLWNVADKQSYEFMTTFYHEWLDNKKEIPTAFYTAQHKMREQYKAPFNPSLWAGFILAE